MDPKYAQLEKDHAEVTKIKNIQAVFFGNYQIDAWYFSPYPDEYCNQKNIYICHNCLKYMKSPGTFVKHQKECPTMHPPGKKIYEKDSAAVYEVDGKDSKLFCQNLCLLSKLFLDHKMVYFDIEPFYFYILCERQNDGRYCLAGYFSKEKNCILDYNLSCIMVLPPYQRKGYGRFLLEFSYELSKKEKLPGTPEKPLSDLGLRTYRNFWASEILRLLKLNGPATTVSDLVEFTGFRQEDIISTLTALNLLHYWKGDHLIQFTPKMLDDLIKVYPSKPKMVDSNLLQWTPVKLEAPIPERKRRKPSASYKE